MVRKDDQSRLNNLIDDILVQFPLVVRKIIVSARMQALPGPSDMQARVLSGLAVGPLKPSEISKVYFISKPNVTTLINKLIADGYAERSRDKRDGRVKKVVITDEGRQLVLKRRQILREYILKAFKGIDPDEIDEIFASVGRFRDLLVRLNNII